jgi:hypothetical protein
MWTYQTLSTKYSDRSVRVSTRRTAWPTSELGSVAANLLGREACASWSVGKITRQLPNGSSTARSALLGSRPRAAGRVKWRTNKPAAMPIASQCAWRRTDIVVRQEVLLCQ